MRIVLLIVANISKVYLQDAEITTILSETDNEQILNEFVFEEKIPEEWRNLLLRDIQEVADNSEAQNCTTSGENAGPEVTGGRAVMKTTATAGIGKIQGPSPPPIVCRIQPPCILICTRRRKIIARRRCLRY